MSQFAKSVATAVVCASIAVTGGGCQNIDQDAVKAAYDLLNQQQELTLETIIAGLKEGLEVATKRAVEDVSVPGEGFWQNPSIRIPLPEELEKVGNTLTDIGFGRQVEDFRMKVNEAAEVAAGEATAIFVDSIMNMTFEDAKGILHGGETAATEFFRRTAGPVLRDRYRPVIDAKMNEVGLVRQYNDLVSRYNAIPFVPDVTFNLTDYITEEGIDGLFTVLAEEEKKIRANPAKRTTELLQRVFAAQD